MALNIKDAETERLATEIAALANETKTQAVRVALVERRDRMALLRAESRRERHLRHFLLEEAWPQIPTDQRGVPLTRDEREEILGYGPDGL
ncbi:MULTISPECIES: type II toxin-antitoxin system VapB family antitoxin [unclassified Frankia]|nr:MULTISPECIES: type II toxin-antitoxin system VapB family antitoxin [unclassified Frankia]